MTTDNKYKNNEEAVTAYQTGDNEALVYLRDANLSFYRHMSKKIEYAFQNRVPEREPKDIYYQKIKDAAGLYDPSHGTKFLTLLGTMFKRELINEYIKAARFRKVKTREDYEKKEITPAAKWDFDFALFMALESEQELKPREEEYLKIKFHTNATDKVACKILEISERTLYYMKTVLKKKFKKYRDWKVECGEYKYHK